MDSCPLPVLYCFELLKISLIHTHCQHQRSENTNMFNSEIYLPTHVLAIQRRGRGEREWQRDWWKCASCSWCFAKRKTAENTCTFIGFFYDKSWPWTSFLVHQVGSWIILINRHKFGKKLYSPVRISILTFCIRNPWLTFKILPENMP